VRFAWPAPSGWQYTSRDTIKHLLAWQWNGAQLICVSCMSIGAGLDLSERFGCSSLGVSVSITW
jgi:hypothetical protein